MDVRTVIKEAQMIQSWGLPMLVMRIGEIHNKHSEGLKLTNSEKLIIGLRYSEFLSEGTTEMDYYQASLKRNTVLQKLGIDFNELIVMCKQVCGLH